MGERQLSFLMGTIMSFECGNFLFNFSERLSHKDLAGFVVLHSYHAKVSCTNTINCT